MNDYDSDSSAGGEDVQTSVVLGYASTEATSDDFSQLGGRATWLDEKSAPPAGLAKCKTCNGGMSLLLQLHADLPDSFPHHERRLYVFACRKRACRRKDGSVRALRAVRAHDALNAASKAKSVEAKGHATAKPAANLGETLFGVAAPTPAQANPFSATPTSRTPANPFTSAKPTLDEALSTEVPPTANSLSTTFAQKARISTTSASSATPTPAAVSEPWEEDENPYPSYHIDADYEYLEPEPASVPANARIDTEGGGSSSSAADDKTAFESSMDKTFQQFADKLAQNPEQVLRYEFAGLPLLYSKSDTTGRLLVPISESSPRAATPAFHASRIPRCPACGASRVFELQLTPHAIAELEAAEMGIEGMEWGTILIGVCSADCIEADQGPGKVGYLEEWVGVQWEEVLAEKRR